MSMQVTADIIEGSSLSQSWTDGSRLIRCFLVTGIPAATRSDPYVMIRGLFAGGVPRLGSPHPAQSSLRLTQHAIRPAGNTNDLYIYCTYEGPRFDGQAATPFTYLVEDDTTLTNEAEVIDDDGLALQVIYQAGAGAKGARRFPTGDPRNNQNVGYRPANANILRPRQVLMVSGFLIGRKPDVRIQSAVGAVNDQNWPTSSIFAGDIPLPVGHWLCTRASAHVETPKNPFDPEKKIYRVQAQFQSYLTRRSWAVPFVYRNVAGTIPPEILGFANEISQLMHKPYVQGQVNLINGGVNGFMKYGPYETRNFKNVFGF